MDRLYPDTLDAIERSCGKKIVGLEFIGEPRRSRETMLRFTFDDDTALDVWDDGQSCCEDRYVTTDDDLKYYVGSILFDIEVDDGPDQDEDTYGETHECAFVHIKTSKGVFTMETHNEHNGYYSGFAITARTVKIQKQEAQDE